MSLSGAIASSSSRPGGPRGSIASARRISHPVTHIHKDSHTDSHKEEERKKRKESGVGASTGKSKSNCILLLSLSLAASLIMFVASSVPFGSNG